MCNKSCLTLVLFLFVFQTYAADTAYRKMDIRSETDSIPLQPLKVIHDLFGDIYAISNWYIGGDTVKTKIYITKFNRNGQKIWNRIFQNTGKGYPRAYDAVSLGQTICVGGETHSGNDNTPLLIRMDSAGNTLWQKDSLGSFNKGSISKLIFKDFLYIGGNQIAMMDETGTLLWTSPVYAYNMAVDTKGRIVLTTLDTLGFGQLLRYTKQGQKEWTKPVLADHCKVSCDFMNNIYVLCDLPKYELIKYDSSGNKLWSRSNFHFSNFFGDIGFEVLCDYNNNVYAVGISDTVFKFDGNGNLLYKKSMNGLDIYRISCYISSSNLLFIGGSFFNGMDYSVRAVSFNQIGKINWIAEHDAHAVKQEFAVSIDVQEGDAVYLLENKEQNGRLLQFTLPSWQSRDMSDICVSSVSYFSFNHDLVEVNVFNGGLNFINYPSVRLVDASGDTISNRKNQVMIFGQMENSVHKYIDSIYKKSILDFRTCKVLLSLGMGDTTFEIPWCDALSLIKNEKPECRVYPNPVSEHLIIDYPFKVNEELRFILYDVNGKKIMDCSVDTSIKEIKTAGLQGIYFYALYSASGTIKTGKLLAE